MDIVFANMHPGRVSDDDQGKLMRLRESIRDHGAILSGRGTHHADMAPRDAPDRDAPRSGDPRLLFCAPMMLAPAGRSGQSALRADVRVFAAHQSVCCAHVVSGNTPMAQKIARSVDLAHSLAVSMALTYV